ncbi:MAG: hypothetical protein KU37_02465 [Sulfuricurvum sp. PC08-66]|nr:MAG: hypothetical protein KU37_02465 [Sulfuricurvum sp. PC08-66]
MNVALIGSGNAFFMDEGAGLYAGKYLKENYDFAPAIDIVDGGTLGFRLMPLLQEYDYVLIANTSSRDAIDAGTIEVLDAQTLIDQAGLKKTANEVEIAEMLQICSMARHCADVTLVSIVPLDIVSVQVDLTPTLKSAWSRYIETILGELARRGIIASPKAGRVTLETIIDIFAHPSIEHGRGF